jgi:cell division protein FtsZ
LFEGNRRRKAAEQGIQELKAAVDTLITIPNQRLLTLSNEPMPLLDTFRRADEVLLHAVQGISDLIQYHGYINVDFADVKTIMNEQGLALMGTGRASGEKRALRAMEQAISSPLLEDVSIAGARGMLINITGGRDITLQEVNEAISLAHDSADPEANIIFGSLIDESIRDDVKITIIATGFIGRETKALRPPQVEQRSPVRLPMAASATSTPIPLAHHEELVSLVPSKASVRAATGEHRSLAPRLYTSKESLLLDEDQYDIPTFLRRQGLGDLP